MNKIEEIFASKYPENFEVQNIYDCMKEFGEICFNAGRETERISKYNGSSNPKGTSNDTWVDKYDSFEDYLKELYNEK
jgi:hypothetical protein